MDLSYQNNKTVVSSSFLAAVWEEIKTEDTSQLVLVLPTNRACAYLKNIAKTSEKVPFLLPEITTLDAFSGGYIPGVKGHPLQLLRLLYLAYRNVLGEEGLSFEHFYLFGEQMLSDFNEVDLQMVDPKTFFQSLKNIKELESFQIGALDTSQEKYDLFWQQLGKIYHEFQELLTKEKVFYTGSRYRYLSENVKPGKQRVIFAGFTVLSPAEQGFIHHFLDNGKLILEKDYSFKAVSNHESQLRLPSIYSDKRDTQHRTHFVTNGISVSDYECVNNTHQIAAVVAEVSKLQPQQLNQCCIILPDAALAPAVVAALASKNIPANATSGISLAGTPWLHYLELIQQALHGADGHHFATQDIAVLVKDPKFSVPPSLLKKILETQQQLGYLIRASYLKEIIPDGHPLQLLIQLEASNWKQAKSHLISWLAKFTQSHGVFNATLMTTAQAAVDEIELHWQSLSEAAVPTRLWLSEVIKILKQQSIPIQGNAHSGVQIMGMLEVRNLDFDHVFITNVNEGTLPANANANSLIPQDLRYHCNLPTVADKEALYGYYFYRLFFRAKSVHLFYLQSTDAAPSRYIEQLAFELPSIGENLSLKSIKTKVQEVFTEPSLADSELVMTDALKTRLVTYLRDEGLSPSALCDLVACPQKFLMETVLRTPELNDYSSLPNYTLGNTLHDTLELVYLRFLDGKKKVNITPSENKNLDSIAAEEAPKVLTNQFKNQDIDANYILLQQVKTMLRTWFNFERKLLKYNGEIAILGVENQLKEFIPGAEDDAGNPFPILFHGKVDRIHLLKDKIEIVDYKAGKVTDTDLKGKWADFFTRSDKRYGLQLMCYKYLWEKTSGKNADARIFSFVKHQDINLVLKITDFDGNFVSKFEETVSQMLSELIKSSIIAHNPKSLYCQFCT